MIRHGHLDLIGEQMCHIYEKMIERISHQLFLNICTPDEFPSLTKSRPLMVLDGYLYTEDRRADTTT